MQYESFGNEENKVGYVFDQKNDGSNVEFSLCLTSGYVWNPRFSSSSDVKISSVRMDKEMREALTAYGEAKKAQRDFERRYLEEKGKYQNVSS